MVTYYDFRDLQAGNTTTLPTGFWRKISHDGGTTFADERRVGGPFDMKLAPNAEGFFIGDYRGSTCFRRRRSIRSSSRPTRAT